MGVVGFFVVVVIAALVVIALLQSIKTIGPTEVGLVTKRFSFRQAARTTTRSRSTVRPATRPSC